MNWTVIIVVGVALLALVVFLVRQNFRDEKKYESQLKNDYRRSKEEEGDIDVEDKMK